MRRNVTEFTQLRRHNISLAAARVTIQCRRASVHCVNRPPTSLEDNY